MIIRHKPNLIKNFFINRHNDIKINPVFNTINNTIDYTQNQIINNIIFEIKSLANNITSNSRKKIFKNYNDIDVLNEIKNYLINNEKNIKIIIFNYNKNINIELIKNFIVVDCINNDEITENIQFDIKTNIKKLDNNKVTLGFVNYNFYNNNNDILLNKAAIPSFFKYNDNNKYNITIINDISPNINRLPNNFKNYDFNELNKCKYGNFASYIDLSHAIKIDLLIDLCETKYLILCDCDIIFRKNIDNYIDLFNNYDILGTIEQNRIVPFLLFLNIEKIKEAKFKFSDISIALTNDYINTGSNLLAKINKFNFKEINIYDIIYHYGAASQYCRLDKTKSNYIYHMEYIHENVRNMTIDDFLKLM